MCVIQASPACEEVLPASEMAQVRASSWDIYFAHVDLEIHAHVRILRIDEHSKVTVVYI